MTRHFPSSTSSAQSPDPRVPGSCSPSSSAPSRRPGRRVRSPSSSGPSSTACSRSAPVVGSTRSFGVTSSSATAEARRLGPDGGRGVDLVDTAADVATRWRGACDLTCVGRPPGMALEHQRRDAGHHGRRHRGPAQADVVPSTTQLGQSSAKALPSASVETMCAPGAAMSGFAKPSCVVPSARPVGERVIDAHRRALVVDRADRERERIVAGAYAGGILGGAAVARGGDDEDAAGSTPPRRRRRADRSGRTPRRSSDSDRLTTRMLYSSLWSTANWSP